jgi:hypothetical protein
MIAFPRSFCARGRGESQRLLPAAWVAALAVVTSAAVDRATAAITVGVIGDSLSSEYQYTSASFARNWLEQAAESGAINAGPIGSYPPPRDNGYAYNWAQGGDTSAAILANGGQVDGLTAQIPTAGIDYAVLEIGSDDIGPGGAAYNGIYNDTWTQGQINAKVSSVVSNINTAVQDLLATGVKVIVATAADHSLAPGIVAMYPNNMQRQNVSNVVAQINQGIINVAQQNHVVVADLGAFQTAAMGTDLSMKTSILIGNVSIDLTQSATSNPSNAAWIFGGTHPNSTLQGVMANLFAQAADDAYNAGLPLFSEQQLLATQGLAYGGSNTLLAQIGSYSSFVHDFAPPPPGRGDANGDGVVNGLDVSLAASNWLQIGSNLPGDVNGDGVVNGLDISTMAANWLKTYGAGGGTTAAPEPATWLLAALGVLTFAGIRATRRRVAEENSARSIGRA